MKKILLITAIMAAPAMSAEYTPVIYAGTNLSGLGYNYVGTTASGISVLSEVYNQSQMKITLVDTNYEPSLEAVIAQGENILPSVTNWPDGYPGGFFSNYPGLPDTPDNFAALGVTATTTAAEFKTIADSILVLAKAAERGTHYLYNEVPGYIARGVSGNHVLISDQVAYFTVPESNLYYCDLQQWDMSQPFTDNLPSCTNIGYQKYPIDMGGANIIMPGYQDIFNDSGIGVVKQQPTGYTSSEADLVLLTPDHSPIVFAQKQIAANSNGTTRVTSGSEPFIIFKDVNGTTRMYQYKNGELSEASGNIGDFRPGSEAVPGTIVDITQDRVLFASADQQYLCEKDTITEDDMSFTAYLDRMVAEGGGYEIFANYPDKPANYEELIVQYGIQDIFPSGISDAEFKQKSDDLLLATFEEGIAGLNAVGCITGTTQAVGTGNGAALHVFNPMSENPLFIGIKVNTELAGGISVSTPIFNKNGEQTGSLNELMLNQLRQSDYGYAVDLSIEKLKAAYPGVMDNYPELPTASGLPVFDNVFDYRAFVASFVLNDAPFRATTSGASSYYGLLPMFEFSDNNGSLNFNGGKYTFFNPAETVTVKVTPADETVDPYLNTYTSLSVDIVGQAYASEVNCQIGDSALNITNSAYGSWGGDNRLTLPLNWTSQSVAGTITHTGNADIEANGSLITADLLAEMTTRTIPVSCQASLSDAQGNIIPVVVQNASITLDDGIHGGSGSFTGSIEIPAGVNPADIQVSVTINGRTITTTVDENGNFTFDELRDGDFAVSFHADNYVQSCVNESISNGSNIDIGTVSLFAGDINNDGEIDIADFTFLSGRYGSAAGDELYTAAADLNKDDLINIQDLAILASHFGSTQCSPQ